jgi:gamma-glutamylcyclotransferase (GGCT)/AIG2-like uncharacterized protein YtfP
MSTPKVLFIYGTLRGDLKHDLADVLAQDASFLGEGTVRGRLFSLGSYPGMVPSERDSDVIRGELYEVPAEKWQKVVELLDAYEGCGPDDLEPHEYRRQLVEATTSSGRKVRAWAYILNRPTTGLEEIPSGDYLAWRATNGGEILR